MIETREATVVVTHIIMRFVPCSCAGLRRVCAPARTGRCRQYSHFRRNLSAPVDLLLRRSSAVCARCVAISQRNQDVTALARVILFVIALRPLAPRGAAGAHHDGLPHQLSPLMPVACRRLCLCEGFAGPLRDVVNPLLSRPTPSSHAFDCSLLYHFG